jgi:hypothetical protein
MKEFISKYNLYTKSKFIKKQNTFITSGHCTGHGVIARNVEITNNSVITYF